MKTDSRTLFKHVLLLPKEKTPTRKLIKVSALACFLVACTMMRETPWEADKTAAQAATVHLLNFGRINDHYYRGAQPTAAQYGELKAIGVKTVVDLRDDAQPYAKPAAEHAGLRYFNLPLN